EHVSSAQRSFLEEQCYAANIHACFAIPTLKEEPEAGSIFPCDEQKRKLAAVSFHRAKNHKRGPQELVSVYLSDVHAREWMNKTDAEIYDECWYLAREVYPALPKLFSPFSISRRPEAIPVHAVGRYADADRFQKVQRGRKVYFCGDYLATATIEGAIATGLAVQGIDSE
ncbi:MAG: FAD-dependent oxidoreductase, partial [Myxococcota bacterium]|nr:FAD-dependent oxidoreductase [Myxococcota bacterium]